MADAVADGRITILETKTQNQNAVLGTTTFTGNLNVSNGLASYIQMSGSGSVSCGSVSSTGNIEGRDITANNNLYVAQDAIIQDELYITSVKPKTSDLTQTINIGPSSQLGNTVLNGCISMPLMSSFFGFGVNNGFLNQF